ncbi:tubulin-specific chaperone cofactor E-like protein [Eupeodes corollae]|uniref:tubulin-specific chaperone cofactor E-like protein n=1 Tax=Eupeodes corollae TaxID=290404 RepID=UPI00248F8625|nr:tubulin-specific chaperone cofactor E-like protein [Eupeodes corollae]XP_055915696.1 tubulin-specific chaperone cofactor E-like protein [Eupeodes corollae]XP_055915697.1 tubulin-specific chaperone cofactor E-like protein [Eupeodes corollae]XP_055915698.1 tubulin-specific chaperone cofactor E-like protein [Eupeodes corollae]XP_055915699.1 tubulin-specific chaperone cofactor E-like protein [Eupeodes corollae]XP_055915700.1 tubulin-specific chaperone cofactor E-like protein [Eupeodes corollae]
MPSLLEALERKYGLSEDIDIEESVVPIYVPKLPPLLCVPELLVLNDCDIDCAGDTEALKEKCRAVKELDLAQNNLRDWDEIFRILKHMPKIEFLNLSKNRFYGPVTFTPAPAMSGLKSVVLNGTCLNWNSIDMLLKCLPVLEELHLSLNDYQNVLIDTLDEDADAEADEETENRKKRDSEDNNAITNTETPPIAIKDFANTTQTANAEYSNLITNSGADNNKSPSESTSSESSSFKKVPAHNGVKKLHFTGNPVEDWKEICRLGRVFPNLETLVLAECPLKSIEPISPTDSVKVVADDMNNRESPHKYFSNLAILNLSSTKINTWEDIDRLAKFPSLRNLRVQNWPLWEKCEATEHERRQLLIARLPFLKTLNGGGTITADEREDAERAFIRYYMEHPESDIPLRYNELIAKHGKLDRLVNVDLKPEKRVKVNFTFGNNSEARFVDVYRSVIDLKSRLEKIVKLPAKDMRLFYVDQDLKELQGPEEMKFPNKQLYSYNIRSGDEILIIQKNC